jgi:hypothetical protein
MPGQEGGPILTGGRTLTNLAWKAVTQKEKDQLGISSHAPIFKTTLPKNVTSIAELFVDGVRLVGL